MVTWCVHIWYYVTYGQYVCIWLYWWSINHNKAISYVLSIVAPQYSSGNQMRNAVDKIPSQRKTFSMYGKFNQNLCFIRSPSSTNCINLHLFANYSQRNDLLLYNMRKENFICYMRENSIISTNIFIKIGSKGDSLQAFDEFPYDFYCIVTRAAFAVSWWKQEKNHLQLGKWCWIERIPCFHRSFCSYWVIVNGSIPLEKWRW